MTDASKSVRHYTKEDLLAIRCLSPQAYADFDFGNLLTDCLTLLAELDEAKAVADSFTASALRTTLQSMGEQLATLTRQRDGLREAIPFPDLSANSADAIAYELECEHPKYTTTKEAKAVWLRDIAKQLRAFEAARKETNDRIS